MDQIDEVLKDVPESAEASEASATPEAGAEEKVDEAPSPSAADLREQLGDTGKDLSDEDLLAAFGELPEEPKAPEPPKEGEEPPPEPAPWSLPYKLFTADGKQIESLTGLSAEDALAAEVEFTQDGQSVRRTIEGLARTAARVPLQDRRIADVVAQRNAESAKSAETAKELEQRRANDQWFANILSDRTGERFQAAQEKYEQVLLQGGSVSDMAGTAPAAPPASAAPASDRDAQGALIYQQQIVPVLQQMAVGYSQDGTAADAQFQQALMQSLDATAQALIRQEGTHLTAQRLQEIVYSELPARVMDAGLKQVTQQAAEAQGRDPKLMAELANARLALKKAKLAQAPPGSGSKSAAGGGKALAGTIEALEQATSASDVEDWLDDPSTGV
jgi:hypothetical protein